MDYGYMAMVSNPRERGTNIGKRQHLTKSEPIPQPSYDCIYNIISNQVRTNSPTLLYFNT
jgi:hypothetical protein